MIRTPLSWRRSRRRSTARRASVSKDQEEIAKQERYICREEEIKKQKCLISEDH